MIADKMKALVNNSSAIRAMFEEGKRLSSIYGEENIFDYINNLFILKKL